MSLSLESKVILDCCASTQFATLLASRGPFSSIDQLIDISRSIWWHETPVADWLQAFAAHPRIGDIESLKKKFDAFNSFSQGEQATAAASASDATLQSLADWNAKYEAKFGHIFIICAAGKSAEFMLNALKAR